MSILHYILTHVIDLIFTESPFILWNDRVDETCIFMILDRVIANDSLLGIYGNTEVQHHARTRYDHGSYSLLVGWEIFLLQTFQFLEFLD